MRSSIFSRYLSSNLPKPRPLRRAPRSFRIGVEALEDRLAMTVLAPVTYPVDGNLGAIVSGDFNGDGQLDVATVNQGTSSVSVLRGRADGTFQPPQNSPTGASPQSIAVGDFNEDGSLDLVTGNAGDVSVLLGNGDGTFEPPASINLGSNWASVAVGDFNNDGTLDLGAVSSMPYYWGGYYGGGVSYVGRTHVLIGFGNGSFAPPSTLVDHGNGFLVNPTLADFNGDGNLDLAASSADIGYATWYPGNGNGSLGFGAYFNLSIVLDLSAGDVNGDNRPDIVSTTQYPHQISVLLNTGGGTFAAPQTYTSGIAPNTVAIGDLSGDGKPELVVSNAALGTVGILLNTGDGQFRSLGAVDAISYTGFAIADFNGDGRADVAASGGGYNRVDVLLNDGVWPSADDPSITITDVAPVVEGNTGSKKVSFNVTLSAASSKTVTVDYVTVDGSAQVSDGDYGFQSGTLTFAPGQTSKSLVMTIYGDRQGEYDQSFSVILSNAANAFIADDTGLATIVDDEPALSISDAISLPEGNAGTTAFTWTVALSAPSDAPVTVDFRTAELTEDDQYNYGFTAATSGVDFVSGSGVLTFAAGETTRTVTVFVKGDRDSEFAETFAVELTNPSGARLVGERAFGTILNDEPYVNIVANAGSTVTEGNTGTTAATFTISLSAASDAPVTVSYQTIDDTASAGSDYGGVTSTITLAPGQTLATISILVNGDAVGESTERFYVQLTSATGATLNSTLAAGEIIDDDKKPTVRISDASITEGNSGTRTMTFTVTLSQASSSQVSVNYATANGTAKTGDNDYLAKSGTLIFSPGQTTKTITITVNGDTKKESNEKFYVKLSGPINATIADGQGDGTILNDDSRSGHRNGRLSFGLSESLQDDWDRVLRRRIR